MIGKIPVFTFLFVAAIALGCTSTEGRTAAGPKQSETAAVKLDKAKTETKEAARAVQDYAFAQKAELLDKMNKDLDKVQEELDRLSGKVDRSSDMAKADAKAKLEAVRAKWVQAKKQLDQVKSATESDWDEVKSGVRSSYGELNSSIDKTRRWLSDKIEP